MSPFFAAQVQNQFAHCTRAGINTRSVVRARQSRIPSLLNPLLGSSAFSFFIGVGSLAPFSLANLIPNRLNRCCSCKFSSLTLVFYSNARSADASDLQAPTHISGCAPRRRRRWDSSTAAARFASKCSRPSSRRRWRQNLQGRKRDAALQRPPHRGRAD